MSAAPDAIAPTQPQSQPNTSVAEKAVEKSPTVAQSNHLVNLSGSTDSAVLAEQWRTIVDELGLKAYARQLPYQSELIELNESHLVLRCEKASLATDENALKMLRQNLDDYFAARQQTAPKLQVHIAEAGQVRFSPQKMALQQREDNLAQAKAALTGHPVINRIVNEFDGMILPNSITPE